MIPTLKNLVIETCVKKLEDSLLEKSDDDELPVTALTMVTARVAPHLKNDVYLPATLCEPILQTVLKKHGSDFLKLFRDRNRCELKILDLSNANLRDQSLLTGLLEHSLEELNLSNTVLRSETANKLKKLSNSLRVLNLSRTVSSWKRNGAPFLKSLQKLTRLDVSFVTESGQDDCLKNISTLKFLEWLDLSGWHITDITPLVNLSSSLKSLYLFEVCKYPLVKNQLSGFLQNMTSLTHLDISREIENQERQPPGQPGEQEAPSQQGYLTRDFIEAIAALPNLVYLDISGCRGLLQPDLDALNLDKLSFLGLFKTGLEFYQNIPVQTITGAASEKQLLVALEVYVRRPSYIEICLNLLGKRIYQNDCSSYERTLQLVVAAAKENLRSGHIQTEATYCMNRLLLHMQDQTYSLELRRFTISTVLDIMNRQMSGLIQGRCCQCLLLCGLPDHVEYEAERICELMLRIVEAYQDYDFTLVALGIFNAIICCPGVKTVHSKNFGAIKIVMNIIRQKCSALAMDRLMDMCWSVLWNIADETPENSECFVKNGGMELFTDCLKVFEDDEVLQKVMLGLMGNIAEVKHLRHIFMKEEYIEIFMNMLDHREHDFELSYNSAGVLSHVTSDGDEAWTLMNISRSQCMDAMIESMSLWDITKTRQINYRSLEPILRLVPCSNAPAAQYWALWALANLTKVYPAKYCELLVGENGVSILRALIASPQANDAMKELAEITLNTIRTHLGIDALG